jgi:hypothetical protein
VKRDAWCVLRKEQITQRRESVRIRLSDLESVESLRGESFRKVVAELEGYDSSVMGKVVRDR